MPPDVVTFLVPLWAPGARLWCGCAVCCVVPLYGRAYCCFSVVSLAELLPKRA